MTATVPLFLVVNAQSPAKTAQELIAYGKLQATGLTFGSPGNGSLPHLAAELFLRDARVKGLTVQYRGDVMARPEEHTSELQSLMRISNAIFCLKKQITTHRIDN